MQHDNHLQIRKGNFQIEFNSEFIGWEWIPEPNSYFSIDFLSIDALNNTAFDFGNLVYSTNENIKGTELYNNTNRTYPNTHFDRWIEYERIPHIPDNNSDVRDEKKKEFIKKANRAIDQYNNEVYQYYNRYNSYLYEIRSNRLDIVSDVFLEVLSWPIEFIIPIKHPFYPFVSPYVPDPDLIQ